MVDSSYNVKILVQLPAPDSKNHHTQAPFKRLFVKGKDFIYLSQLMKSLRKIKLNIK